ncbi:hypothetical protein NE237_017817 [Protea cynaroides]|uniref:Uncharacterized protein n=1 Tax=Protea cynaroides TaxID=273540 RepID=A0A9Q0QNF2_9MAGN|nr:hypothetical protein NE237_017817 [Protea cynaroides]
MLGLFCFLFMDNFIFSAEKYHTKKQKQKKNIKGDSRNIFKAMNWIQRKMYLYNVTFGLYMLDWWEHYIINILLIILLWFVCYNGSRSAADFYIRPLVLWEKRNDATKGRQ